MEESQSKPRCSRRLTSQPSLTLETKLFQTKRTRLIVSKSPGLLGTCVPTSSGTLVTPTIYGIPAFTKEVLWPQEDIRTDHSVTVNGSIPKLAPSTADLECVTPPTTITAKAIPYSAP